ncbi:hypothetical protein AAU57_10860 [Nonlabens sp. YIK11]|uniref:T9SS type A sorting domain-containing protein n=1 Tax=Nonlabens sp. YIK11 TaxID=1453349 RepID=UPI0006DC479E|nr:T9SS type A sorting domain-containing protein [Nonlabens sp. YIK11]KQC33775.1 hypothetical protein AAU57_10860 [Nonlabens sp. YIK11]
MKPLLFLLIFFATNLTVAQDPRLLEQEWYLFDLILDGENYVPPTHEEIPFIPLQFNESNELQTYVCPGTAGIAPVIYENTDTFILQNLVQLAGSCSTLENVIYTQRYFSFYLRNENTVYRYEISQDGDERRLILTAPNGDQAKYSNLVLSHNSVTKSQIKMYPIPAREVLHLEFPSQVDISEVKIYNLQGKEVFRSKNNLTKLPVSGLNAGIYFLEIIDNREPNIFLKFVKS